MEKDDLNKSMCEELFGGKLEVTVVPDASKSLTRGGRRTACTGCFRLQWNAFSLLKKWSRRWVTFAGWKKHVPANYRQPHKLKWAVFRNCGNGRESWPKERGMDRGPSQEEPPEKKPKLEAKKPDWPRCARPENVLIKSAEEVSYAGI